RGTGTYAAPGEKIKVSVPATAINQGLQVQIGSHTDLLWAKPNWVRFPAIVRSYPIDAAQITVASAFGGPIYITVPG
ncbi:MAG TPA: M60 family peptidase N-terminal accessory domain-containing protein, partial [Pseudomonadota bacterium]|nr:M60 family peptidase N-terminal accessory domain-containing protein [Pseudomonadota bacterium]